MFEFSSLKKWNSLLLVVFCLGCQTKPTKIFSDEEVKSKDQWASELISEKTVILDVRTPFDFNLNHIPNSINIQWQDFSSPNHPGVLIPDNYAIARRLALWGIDPQTPVLVVGYGSLGSAEEGRVAWMLSHLGIQKIETAKFDLFRGRAPEAQTLPVVNKPYWTPEDKFNSDLNYEQLLEKTRHSQKIRFIDARKNEDFKKDIFFSSVAKFENRSWASFFDFNGRSRTAVFSELVDAGWKLDDEIIVVSENGVKSGAVVFALRKMGFSKVWNFSGGYELIQFHRKNRPK